MDFEIAKIGERGQVVIPQSLRDEMSIHKGDKFMVIQRGDMLILKKLIAPSMEDFNKMLNKSQAHAKKHGLTETDLQDAIKRARQK
ncbi:MAG: AbrB/MazE/SpoVT family DNA-binding domain-containing protein [Nanoarchaeota archaeon]